MQYEVKAGLFVTKFWRLLPKENEKESCCTWLTLNKLYCWIWWTCLPVGKNCASSYLYDFIIQDITCTHIIVQVKNGMLFVEKEIITRSITLIFLFLPFFSFFLNILCKNFFFFQLAGYISLYNIFWFICLFMFA